MAREMVVHLVRGTHEHNQRLCCPLLGIFGAKDRGIPPEDVRVFEARLKRRGKKAEIHLFPDVGHAFANPNNRAGYNASAAQKGWKLTLDFLKRYLG